MCVTWHALVSALVARVRGGHFVTEQEVAALLKGVTKDELLRAFDDDGEAFAHARAVVMRLHLP